MNFKDIIKKYRDRNKSTISSDNVSHEMNAIVLYSTSNALFDFNGVMIDDVMSYGKSKGYNIDKIVFLTSYDIEFTDENKGVKKVDDNSIRISQNYRMKSDAKISIIEEDGKVIARVFMGSYIIVGKIREK